MKISNEAKREFERVVLSGYDPSQAFDRYRKEMFILCVTYLLEMGSAKIDIANAIYQSSGQDIRSYLKNPSIDNLGRAYDFLQSKPAEYPYPNAAYMASMQMYLAAAMVSGAAFR